MDAVLGQLPAKARSLGPSERKPHIAAHDGIDEARAGAPELERMAGGAGSSLGRGGMITKVLAAKRAASSGASTVIAYGREPDVLVRLAAGAVIVDDGAAAKVRDEGKSLLPIGMTEVQGEFHRGDVIAVRGLDGTELARGLANYGSSEARLISRRPSSEFEKLLGYTAEPEMIHRDNLVLA